MATFLRTLTPEEIADLAAGRARLALVKPDRRGRPAESNASIDDARDIASNLARMTKRERGEEYLLQVAPTRAQLAQIARVLDIPAAKSDNMERLREKIIEAAIGYRLRSDAIRGPAAIRGMEAAKWRGLRPDGSGGEARGGLVEGTEPPQGRS